MLSLIRERLNFTVNWCNLRDDKLNCIDIETKILENREIEHPETFMKREDHD